MTNDGWGKEWPVDPQNEWFKQQPDMLAPKLEGGWPKSLIEEGGKLIVELLPKIYGIDIAAKPDQTVTAIIKDNKIEKVYNNLHPTHDPYTNPNAHIYYQCNCGKILDPGTKSFAALNNAASDKGWKVRWGSETYVPYCVECGKDVE